MSLSRGLGSVVGVAIGVLAASPTDAALGQAPPPFDSATPGVVVSQLGPDRFDAPTPRLASGRPGHELVVYATGEAVYARPLDANGPSGPQVLVCRAQVGADLAVAAENHTKPPLCNFPTTQWLINATPRQPNLHLKPGGHLVAFGAPRTAHHLVALEDAGFQVRYMLLWLFGQGFPKSRNLTGERGGWGTALKPGYDRSCSSESR